MEEKFIYPKRLPYLDSIRGIAAMMVLCGHFINWHYEQNLTIKWLSIIFNANDAVSFFFVLSGFVLSYPYLNNENPLYLNQFFVKRIFRLYPGFVIAVFMNLIVTYRHDIFTWHKLFEVFIKNDGHFYDEIFLFRTNNHFYLPGWTLNIELLISFAIPFLILIGRKNNLYLKYMAWISLLLITMLNGFFFHFILGIILVSKFQYIKSESFKTSKYIKYRWILIPIACFLFSLRMINRIIPLPKGINYLLDFLRIDFFVFTGIGAFILLIYIIHYVKVQKFLENKILLFYGKISYGIYLTHWTFVWFIGDHWVKILTYFPNTAIALITVLIVIIAVSTISAFLLNKFIEEPFIKIGNKFVAKMKKGLYV